MDLYVIDMARQPNGSTNIIVLPITVYVTSSNLYLDHKQKLGNHDAYQSFHG